jgi:hypothetical protein
MKPFKCTEEDENWMAEHMDETGGYLVKGSELRWFVEHFVEKDRKERSVINRIKRAFKCLSCLTDINALK